MNRYVTPLVLAATCTALIVSQTTTGQSMKLDPVAAVAMTLRNPYPHPSNMVSFAGGEAGGPQSIAGGSPFDIYQVPEGHTLVLTRYDIFQNGNGVANLRFDHGGTTTLLRSFGGAGNGTGDYNSYTAHERGGMLVPAGATVQLYAPTTTAVIRYWNLDGYLVSD